MTTMMMMVVVMMMTMTMMDPLQLHLCTVHIHMYLSENQKRLSCLSGGCSHGLPVIQKSTRSKGRYQSRQSSYLYLHVPCTLGRQSGNVIAVAG